MLHCITYENQFVFLGGRNMLDRNLFTNVVVDEAKVGENALFDF